MFGRRDFLQMAGAATTALAVPAWGHAPPPDWTVPEDWAPTVVGIRDDVAAGQIHVVPQNFSLYLTTEPGKAIRYRVGIARGNLYESGRFYLGAKKEWPSWRPTDEMIARNPGAYARFAGGMPGGPTNPLGSRALYLFTPQRGDTYLRIHGTPEPWTVGREVSNGCVRLVNAHVEDLFLRAQIGMPIFLYPKVQA